LTPGRFLAGPGSSIAKYSVSILAPVTTTKAGSTADSAAGSAAGSTASAGSWKRSRSSFALVLEEFHQDRALFWY